VLKQELRKIPGLGIGCEKVGHIFIDRSNPEKAIASIKAAKEKIVNGTSVLFSPEGTRSKTGKMGDFKKGAFIFAIEIGVPLLPVTLYTLLSPLRFFRREDFLNIQSPTVTGTPKLSMIS
jgi:1-acyl-sn-glycerol-3-phosphate acyltransferase